MIFFEFKNLKKKKEREMKKENMKRLERPLAPNLDTQLYNISMQHYW